MAGGRPPYFDTPEQLQAAIEDYFNPEVFETTEVKCNNGATVVRSLGRQPREKVTITGLALHLGFESRQSFYDYEEREEYSYIIKRARLQVEMSYEERLMSQSCTGAIFALKNMGWKDKQETELSGQVGVKQITGMIVK
jgi:hypothetical protein